MPTTSFESGSSSTTSTRTPSSAGYVGSSAGTLAVGCRRSVSPAVRAGMRGERDREDGSAPLFGALDAHAPAVQLDDVANDGKPESEAALAPGRTAVALLEAFEDVGQQGRADALPSVAHCDLDVGANPFQQDLHAPALRREFDGVREQVPHDLLEAVGVARDDPGLGVEHRPQLDDFGLGCRPHDLDRCLDRGARA